MSVDTIPYDAATRKALAKSFIENVILAQYHQLTGWQKVTQQTAQLDSGYLGQHMVSLISGTPGRGAGSRGKGHDLVDGSEIKTASALGGIDAPRWNHASFGKPKNVDAYLKSKYVYFVLFDTATRYEEFPLRLRVWRVAPGTDTVFTSVVKKWATRKSSGNFQLHPPCWQAGSRVTNECGNLELPMIFEAVQRCSGRSKASTSWTSSPGTPTPARSPYSCLVFSAYVAARRFGNPLIRGHLIDIGRGTELLFAFVSTFDEALTLDEWQFAALHASLLAAEWQAIETYVSIDNADAEGEFDEAFGELVLLEAGMAQRRTPFELVVDTTGLLRLLGPMTALSVDIPGDVHVQPTGASLELGPDCYVRCRDLQLGGETIQIVRRATPTNGGGTVEDEASVVLEVSGEFRCDGMLSANPSASAFELRVRDAVLSYPWVSYRAEFPERTADSGERANAQSDSSTCS